MQKRPTNLRKQEKAALSEEERQKIQLEKRVRRKKEQKALDITAPRVALLLPPLDDPIRESIVQYFGLSQGDNQPDTGKKFPVAQMRFDMAKRNIILASDGLSRIVTGGRGAKFTPMSIGAYLFKTDNVKSFQPYDEAAVLLGPAARKHVLSLPPKEMLALLKAKELDIDLKQHRDVKSRLLSNQPLGAADCKLRDDTVFLISTSVSNYNSGHHRQQQENMIQQSFADDSAMETETTIWVWGFASTEDDTLQLDLGIKDILASSLAALIEGAITVSS